MTVASAVTPAIRPGAPPARYWALFHAVVAERGRRIRSAVLISSVAGLVAVFALGASILPDSQSVNLLNGYLVYLAVQALVLALALLRLSGGEYRKALIVGEFARRASYEEWEKATGEPAPPLTPESAAEWLTRHPDQDELLMQRLHALINVGDRDGAHATLARYPRDTAEQRYSHASDTWFLAFLDGSDAEPNEVEALAAGLEDPETRIRATVSVASLRAYLAAARGGDWVAKMAAGYPAVQGRIADDWRTLTVVRVWTMTMAVTSALLGVAWLAISWLGLEGALFGV
jgi:hypothetical protein